MGMAILPAIPITAEGKTYSLIAASLMWALAALFVSAAPAPALDIPSAFSLPDAPDAGQAQGITVYGDIIAVPLSNGFVKLYFPGETGGSWLAVAKAEFMEGPSSLLGLSAVDRSCLEAGREGLAILSVHEGLCPLEVGVFSSGFSDFRTPWFTLFDSRPVFGLDNITGFASLGCMFVWSQVEGGTDKLGYLGPEGEGTLLLRDGTNGFLDGIVPPEEQIAGIETTFDNGGDLVFITVTDESVYTVRFAEEGVVVESEDLNHPPVFTGAQRAVCLPGASKITLPVVVEDADGDTVNIVQTNFWKGFTGTSIVHSCEREGVFRWRFFATDGRTDEIDIPVREYTIAVGYPDDIDDDGDGYTENEGDCDDTTSEVNPGAPEIVGNGRDENCNGTDTGTYVAFPDPALHACVGLALRQSPDQIPTGFPSSELLGITSLSCNRSLTSPLPHIANLDGISALSNLRELHLLYNRVTDTADLSGLAKLSVLDLDCNMVSTPILSDLPGLESLSLNNNQVSGLFGVSDLPSLESLSLNSNQVSDLSGVGGLPSLKRLFLYGNKISLPVLDRFPSLETLDLGGNLIADTSGISGLTNLTELYLYNNLINTPIFNDLPNLKILRLGGNVIGSNVALLRNLLSLESLYLEDNGITDISGLSGLPSLYGLVLDHNRIAAPALSDLPSLYSISLSYSQVADISGLSGIASLRSLVLDHNVISTPFLKDLPGLEWLGLESNQITDISGLSGLPNLKTLWLGNNLISTAVLNDLPRLGFLRLNDNLISTSAPILNNMPPLAELNLSNNQITENTVLSSLPVSWLLDLGNNMISAPVLSNFPNVYFLSLANNKITDISGLAGPANLTDLVLDVNHIEDISSLSSLNNLQNLHLRDNKITDLSPLGSLANLYNLDIGNNEISDISVLSHLSFLDNVYLDQNCITDFSPVDHLSFVYGTDEQKATCGP